MIESLDTLGGVIDKGTFDRGQANNDRLEKYERTHSENLFAPTFLIGFLPNSLSVSQVNFTGAKVDVWKNGSKPSGGRRNLCLPQGDRAFSSTCYGAFRDPIHFQ